MTTPKVSILVPVYNVEKYLRQCLDSIINQTLKEIEIIIINDGSTDTSLDIIKEYASKDNRIVIIDKKNSGYGHSMNQGLERASGEYIGIVESDDFVELNMFETLYELAKKHDVQVVKSNFYFYWSSPTAKSTKQNFLPQEDINKIITPSNDQSIFWVMPCIWAAIYQTEFLKNNNIKFLETPGASYQDTAFNFKIWASAERVYLTDDAFLHYRQDNETSSVNNPGKAFCVCDEYQEIELFAKKKKLNINIQQLIQRLKFGCFFWNFKRLSYPLNYKFLKHMSSDFKLAQEKQLLSHEFFSKKELKKIETIIKHPTLFFVKELFKK